MRCDENGYGHNVVITVLRIVHEHSHDDCKKERREWTALTDAYSLFIFVGGYSFNFDREVGVLVQDFY